MVYILRSFIINLRFTEYYLNNSNNNALNPFSYYDYNLQFTRMISVDYPIYIIISMMFTLYSFYFTPHNLIYTYFIENPHLNPGTYTQTLEIRKVQKTIRLL